MKYLFILLVSCSAWSQSFENLGSVSTSLGGAGVGSVNLVDGAFNNPAAFALFEQRSLAMSFAKKAFRISLADNGAEALFPALLGYNQTDVKGFRTKAFYFGLAQPLSAKFSLGANLGFQETQLPGKDDKYRQNLADIGVMYRPNTWFSVGAVVKNQPLNDTDLSDTIDKRPTQAVGFEAKYDELVNLRGELEAGKNTVSEQKMIVKAGMEIILNEWLQMRLGYQNNNIISQNYFTAGLGFGGPQFGLHYAYVKESEFEKETHQSIDLAVPF
ncbi:hypothetical protein CIK05_15240 [Bdellovibrio sp. qaytius]|nr:hypothetical protein CIK05_15240 [Bdellovibrio sp. qaytius]